MRDVADAFGVCAVAVRDETVFFKITTPALPRVAYEIACFTRRRAGLFDAIGIWLIAVKPQRDRDIDRVFKIDLETEIIDFNRNKHISEKPEMFGRTLIYLGLAEGIAIYGLVVTILLLGKI